jgi:hypothetical protein
MRDCAIDGREAPEQPSHVRREPNEPEQAHGAFPRAREGPGRSEERSAAGPPGRDHALLLSDDIRSCRAWRDDVDLVPRPGEVESLGFDEVSRRISRCPGVGRREEGDAHARPRIPSSAPGRGAVVFRKEQLAL